VPRWYVGYSNVSDSDDSNTDDPNAGESDTGDAENPMSRVKMLMPVTQMLSIDMPLTQMLLRRWMTRLPSFNQRGLPL